MIIWDADSTGAQDYSSICASIHDEIERREERQLRLRRDSIPAGSPLASSDSSSPLYLDPAALVASTHLIGHMNVLVPPAADWSPGLIAANSKITEPGWVVAWGYGSTANHAGMVIYSGIDADAFSDATTPNYAIKELAIQLAAPFSRTGDASCSPNCSPPPPPSLRQRRWRRYGRRRRRRADIADVRPMWFQPAAAQVLGPRHRVLVAHDERRERDHRHGHLGQQPPRRSWNALDAGTPDAPCEHASPSVEPGLEPEGRRARQLRDRLQPQRAASRRQCEAEGDRPEDDAARHTAACSRFRSNEPLRMWLATSHHQYGTYSRKHSGRTTLKFPHSITSGTLRLVDRAGNTTRIKIAWK